MASLVLSTAGGAVGGALFGPVGALAGRIAGAGLDVFVDEPRVPAALRQSDRTTLQAHRASATWETRGAMARMVLDSVAEALAGKRPTMSLTT